MTPSTAYDVVIVGAGPAGSSAAIRTRAAGLRTLVIEKLPFPRFRVGESLLPSANTLLRELGVWEKVEQAGFIKKFGARFHLAYGPAEKNVVFAHGLIPGLDYSYQVDRARFDALLLDRARELGADFRAETTAVGFDAAPTGHLVRLKSADGTTAEISTRYVIDASGRDAFLPSELKAALDPAAFPKRLAIYNHFRRVPRASDSTGGDTLIVRLAEGWFWIIPIDAERTSVGLVTTNAAFKAAGLSPAEHFARTVAASPRLRDLLADAEPLLNFHVTADYSYYRRQLASARVVLAGDSGGFIDPIFSSGVYLALHAARHAVELVVRAHRENRDITARETRRYTRAVKSHSRVFHRLIEAFYHDASFAVFMDPTPPLGLAPGITSIVAGHTTLTWPLWWRFRVFLLVCRLQRHVSLVPQLSLAEPDLPLAEARTA